APCPRAVGRSRRLQRIIPEIGDGATLWSARRRSRGPDFTGREVQVTCRLGLRDWSGEWDDTYSGVIDYVLYAELEDDESIGEVLLITAVQSTQSIPSFRSLLALDGQTRQPDNVIPLIAGKPTAVRVYADYTPADGPIVVDDEWEEELEVHSSGH